MKKTVKYAIGAAGAIPVFGILAVPAATATTATQTPAHTARKSVRTDLHVRKVIHPDTCTGSKRHVRNQGNLHMVLYSKPVGVGLSRTCIGTIIFSYTGPNPAISASVNVSTVNGHSFCERHVGGTFISDGCHAIFVDSGLAVTGAENRSPDQDPTIYWTFPF